MFLFIWSDEAGWSITDKVLPSCFDERLADAFVIFWTAELEEGSLHCLFSERLYVDILPRERVYACVVHAGRKGTGVGVEVLHLFWNGNGSP